MSVELKSEDGSLNVYCAKCGEKLQATTEKLRELSKTGKFETVNVLCSKCAQSLSFSIQLGSLELGVIK